MYDMYMYVQSTWLGTKSLQAHNMTTIRRSKCIETPLFLDLLFPFHILFSLVLSPVNPPSNVLPCVFLHQIGQPFLSKWRLCVPLKRGAFITQICHMEFLGTYMYGSNAVVFHFVLLYSSSTTNQSMYYISIFLVLCCTCGILRIATHVHTYVTCISIRTVVFLSDSSHQAHRLVAMWQPHHQFAPM